MRIVVLRQLALLRCAILAVFTFGAEAEVLHVHLNLYSFHIVGLAQGFRIPLCSFALRVRWSNV